jgi:DNA-binding NtrC family response regulator
VGKKLIATAIHGFSINRRVRLEFIDATDISGKWIRNTVDRFEMTKRSGAPQSAYAIKNIEKLSFGLQSQLLLLMEKVTSHEAGAKGPMPPAPFISITGCDLDAQADKGAFRKDLYHRLSVLKLTVPPLRQYGIDIVSMAEYFAAYYGIKHNGGICRLSDELLKVLSNYYWPGNVSELKQITKQLVIFDKSRLKNKLPSSLKIKSSKYKDGRANAYVDTDDVHSYIRSHSDVSLKQAKATYAAQVEKKLMKAALRQTSGNCKKAAVLLNISYKSMLNKTKKYQLV